MERLTIRVPTGIEYRSEVYGWDIKSKLADYEDAEEQGLLICLPCKVGDTVWVLTNDSPLGYERAPVTNIRITKNSYRVSCKCDYDDWGNARWVFKPNDFGKRVFLTEGEVKRAAKHG